MIRSLSTLVTLGLAAIMCLFTVGCTYDPPPVITLVAPTQKHFVLGEPIRLLFSEPIRPESLEILVWPGQKDLYTIEKDLKEGVKALMDTCTPTSSPCSKGKATLTLNADGTEAVLTPEDGAFGPLGVPLVMEVTGSLSDLKGRRRNVSTFFDFQIVREIWNPYADVVTGDIEGDTEDVVLEPLGIPEGSYLFLADFTNPVKISQQFWTDVRANQLTGDFVMLMTDGDPVKGAPVNTTDPTQLIMDTGVEGFVFTVHGKVNRDQEGKLTFKSEPVTLTLTIGPITFALVDMVCVGTIVFGGEKIVWDGTLAVKEVYYEVGGQATVYPADQANFQVVELAAEHIPEGMPRVCTENPCLIVGGNCDLLPQWPPASVCDESN